MIAVALCITAFALTFWAGRRSLGKGVVVLLFFGYFYGILRANFFTSAIYFVFDAGVIALYWSQIGFPPQKISRNAGELNFWVLLLILWPSILVFLPFQPLLVSLVGLRAITFFIPMLIMGTRLRERDLVEISYGLIGLNLLAMAFAAGEYVLGVPQFYPHNATTHLIYVSISAGDFLRIPATFVNAHGYGGTMAYTLPFLLAFWNGAKRPIIRCLTILSIASALLGVLMSAARTCFLMAAVVIVAALFTIRISAGRRLTFLVMVAGIVFMTLGNERLQRFKSLSDTEYVSARVAGSVNLGFLEILMEHPMGNGLGGGSTSMPAFLEGYVRDPIAIENEFGVILAEQGIIGLLFWLGFVAWFVTRAPIAFAAGPWDIARRTGWCLATFSICTAWIGNGLFSSIPATVLMLLIMGWTARPRVQAARKLQGQGAAPLYCYRSASVRLAN